MSRNPLQVVRKQQLVIAMLQGGTRLKGYLHTPPSGRISDFMNTRAVGRPFVSITDAIIRLPDGSEYEAPFITVNRLAITACFPVPEKDADAAEDADVDAGVAKKKR